jgi:hypothetical protein
MISFHANLKVWITEIKAWIYWPRASVQLPRSFLKSLRSDNWKGHRLALFLLLSVEGGNINRRF